MPRNGTGTASIVNSFTPATTISSAAVNANFDDLADELTNSVAADGQTTMTGVLKAANGADTAPSVTFGSDLDTGIYRKAANSLGFATAGNERAYIDSAGKLFALGAFDVAGASNFQAATQHTTIELGDASDTTLARASAGDVNVEGNIMYRAGGTDVAIADGGHGQSTAAAGFAALKQAATESATGVVELATAAEAETGTDTSRAVTPAGVLASIRENAITSDTVQATTSGSSIDFTGVPAGTRRITIQFDEIELSGSDDFLVRIGDAGGIETTGYASQGGNKDIETAVTNGFFILLNSKNDAWTGHVVLTRIGSTNRWICDHMIIGAAGVGDPAFGAGAKTLSAELDRWSLVTDGSDTFDGGQVSALYE